MSETRSLHSKLAQVMYEVGRIPKNGTAPAAMGGFKFVEVGDAADVIRKALAEHKVSMLPSAIELMGESEHPTASGKMMTTMTVRTTWTLTDGDTGETATIQSMGAGADMGDKAAPKAQSSAMKYALLMGFLLSTGDDPERQDSSDRRERPVQPRGVVETVDHSAPPPVRTQDGGLIGIAKVGNGKSDFELRQTPAGPGLSFRLAQGRQGIKVVALGPLAEAIAAIRPTIEDQRVTCWGSITDEEFTKDGKTIRYQVLTLSRIQTPDGMLPMVEEGLEEPPDDIDLIGAA